MDRLVPTRSARLQGARQRPRPDAEKFCGEVSTSCGLLEYAPFAERALRNIATVHSGLMLAARITLPHFSVSSAMSLPKSEDEPASSEASTSANCVFDFGSARIVLMSRLSLSIIS